MKASQTQIVISHRNDESAFTLRLFFALKGFNAVIQNSIDLALSSNASSPSGTVLVCDASDQTLLRAAKKTGPKAFRNVVVIRDGEAAPSSGPGTNARVVPSSTVGQDLIDAVSDCSEGS